MPDMDMKRIRDALNERDAMADAITALRAERDDLKVRLDRAVHAGNVACEIADAKDAEVKRLTTRVAELEGLRDVTALVETAQWARNRLEAIADESWNGDARDFKRSLIGVFADFDEALAKCGSVSALAARVEGGDA